MEGACGAPRGRAPKPGYSRVKAAFAAGMHREGSSPEGPIPAGAW